MCVYHASVIKILLFKTTTEFKFSLEKLCKPYNVPIGLVSCKGQHRLLKDVQRLLIIFLCVLSH